METIVKTNGYTAEGIQSMIHAFNAAVENVFPDCTVRHFYYGDALDMVDFIDGGAYAHFNISANRVSLTGYSMPREILKICESLTYNDDLYNGQLLAIAEQACA